MKYGLILLLSLLMDGAFSSELPQLESSPDGRFGSKCRMGVCHVSIAQLVITPERYHGKLVQVEGIIVVAFEVYGVYSRSGEHQVWVEHEKSDIEKYKELNNTVGFVRGIYDATSFGHMGSWGGTIRKVERFGK